MAWMFTKRQTGYLDEYWGLEGSRTLHSKQMV